jgi:hypothetical protein
MFVRYLALGAVMVSGPLQVRAAPDPPGTAGAKSAVEQAADGLVRAIRSKSVSGVISYVGKDGVTCGDVRFARAEVLAALRDPGSQMHAWLFDDKAFRATPSGATTRSVGYELSSEQLETIEVHQISRDSWDVVFRSHSKYVSATFRWCEDEKRWVVSTGIVCIP